MKNYLVLMIVVLFCAYKSKDKDVKQAIAVHAKEELMFAGINYNVRNGVVTLTGICPSEELKNKVVNRFRSTSGVKCVTDRMAIGPVLLDHDFTLKQKVDSVLSRYATVESSVKRDTVFLTGDAEEKDMVRLVEGLNKLPIANIVNNLTAK